MNSTQCKMARAGLGWRASDLAKSAGIGSATVARFELGENVASASRDAMQLALEEAGAKFSARSGRVSVAVPE